MKTKCASQIYKKMTLAEQTAWDMFYKEMNIPENFKEGTLTKEQREVIAHNMACQATWSLYSIMYEIFNGKRRK